VELGLSSIAGCFRALGFFSLLPCGYDILGPSRRIFLAVGSGLLFAGSPVSSPDRFGVGEVVGEMIVGGLLAVPLVCVVGGISVAGELLDAVRGESLGTAYDPSFGHSSPLALLSRTLVWGTLVAAGVFVTSADLIAASVQRIPLGSVSSIARFGDWAVIEIGELVGRTVECAAPWVGLCLLIELGGLLIIRALPQLTLSNELFLVKTLGMVVLLWLIDRGAMGEVILSLTDLVRGEFTPIGGGETGVFQPTGGAP